MKIKEIFFLIILFLISSCKETPTDPPPNPPPNGNDIVPQTNIEWPSLADTPWPMHHHDPQSTGRSQYAGPQSGMITNKVSIGAVSVAGISIGYNSSVFVGTQDYQSNFYSFDYDGNVNWKTIFSKCYSTPLISSDSTIHIANPWSFLALSHNGDTVWNREIDNNMVAVGINIDQNGNLYYLNLNSTLTVFDKNGNLMWTLEDSRFNNWVDSAPTFSPDGNTLYVQGIDVSVLAVNINTKTIKWTFGDIELCSSPVIDNDGNIFIIPGDFNSQKERKLYSLNPNGEINWEYDFNSYDISDNTEPTIDYNGNVYFATDTLYSITNSGKFRWKFPLKSKTVSPLICDKNNVVYVGTQDTETGPTWDNKIFSINDKGELLWELLETEESLLGVSPAISEDGTLFYPTWRSLNYLIIK